MNCSLSLCPPSPLWHQRHALLLILRLVLVLGSAVEAAEDEELQEKGCPRHADVDQGMEGVDGEEGVEIGVGYEKDVCGVIQYEEAVEEGGGDGAVCEGREARAASHVEAVGDE